MTAVPARRVAAVAVALVALLSACGSGGGSGSDAKDETTTTAASKGDANGAKTVSIKDFAFSPGTLEVKAGTTVTFTNDDDATHTATSDDGAPKAFDTDKIEAGDTAEVTFDDPGTYEYHCDIHEYMKGTVRVLG